MWNQVFFIGDPNVICLAGHICLSTRNLAQHKHLLASLPQRAHFRGSLDKSCNTWSGGHEHEINSSISGRDRTWQADYKWKTWNQVFSIGDPDVICLAWHICLFTCNLAQHKNLPASLPQRAHFTHSFVRPPKYGTGGHEHNFNSSISGRDRTWQAD